MAEVLRDAGYFTAMTGKWHLGQQNGTPPWKRGFERSLNSRYGEDLLSPEGRRATRPGTENLYLNGRRSPKDSPVFGKDWYSTDLFTEWGLKFIDEAQRPSKPFFLYLAQGAVIFRCGAGGDIAKYRGRYMEGWDTLRDARYAKQIEMGLVDPHAGRSARAPPEVARLGHAARETGRSASIRSWRCTRR